MGTADPTRAPRDGHHSTAGVREGTSPSAGTPPRRPRSGVSFVAVASRGLPGLSHRPLPAAPGAGETRERHFLPFPSHLRPDGTRGRGRVDRAPRWWPRSRGDAAHAPVSGCHGPLGSPHCKGPRWGLTRGPSSGAALASLGSPARLVGALVGRCYHPLPTTWGSLSPASVAAGLGDIGEPVVS